jgi:hypothetical protein
MGHLGAEAFGKVLLVDAIGIRNLFPRPPLVPQKMAKEDLRHPATVFNAPNQRSTASIANLKRKLVY